MKGKTAVMIDRDGTMGGTYSMRTPQEYKPYPGTEEAFKLLNKEGLLALIVTNQSCIARGLDQGYDFAGEFAEIGATDWFICPHDTQDGCECRKPGTGLLEQARDRYSLTLADCYMIGDRWSDMVAGGRMGMRLVPVLTGRGRETIGVDRVKWAEFQPVFTARDLLDAVRRIIRLERNKATDL